MKTIMFTKTGLGQTQEKLRRKAFFAEHEGDEEEEEETPPVAIEWTIGAC